MKAMLFGCMTKYFSAPGLGTETANDLGNQSSSCVDHLQKTSTRICVRVRGTRLNISKNRKNQIELAEGGKVS